MEGTRVLLRTRPGLERARWKSQLPWVWLCTLGLVPSASGAGEGGEWMLCVGHGGAGGGGMGEGREVGGDGGDGGVDGGMDG